MTLDPGRTPGISRFGVINAACATHVKVTGARTGDTPHERDARDLRRRENGRMAPTPAPVSSATAGSAGSAGSADRVVRGGVESDARHDDTSRGSRDDDVRVRVERHRAPGLDLLLPDGRVRVQVVVGEATLVDLTTGARSLDGTRVGRPAVRPVVRERPGGDWFCAVAELPPLALAGPGRDPRADVPVDAVLAPGVVALVEEALRAGDDEHARATLREDVLSRLLADRVDRADRAEGAGPGGSHGGTHGAALGGPDDDVERFAGVLARLEAEQGLVTAAEVARAEGATVSDLFRWSDRLLGVPAAEYVAALRFTAFVREAVGRRDPSPAEVLAALRWYDAAGHPPREVARLTGLEVRELHRLVQRLVALLGPA